MLNYRIRPADLVDLARCMEIDASYITNYVWQVQEGFEEPVEPEENEEINHNRPRIVGKNTAPQPPSFRMELVPSRLPRPLAVAAPLNDQELLAEWKKTDYLLVAETMLPDTSMLEIPKDEQPLEGETEEVFQPNLLGYIGLRVDGVRHTAWITTQAVQMEYRRQNVGSQLLTEARQWVDRYRLRSLMVELQTKNFPAIRFYQKNGFFFCGYNNAYYADREIALFFGKRLEKFNYE